MFGRQRRFLERDMLLADGTYAASLSAETDGVEGATYTWTYGDLTGMLSAAELELAEEYLGVIDGGVWEGVNILTRREGRENQAAAVDEVLATILTARARRPQPARDEKSLTSWNGMAASALMEAGGSSPTKR